MGPESEHIYGQFGLTEDEQKNYDHVIAAFDRHFSPQKNVIHERAMFHQRIQKPGESAETYIRILYELAEHCEFGEHKNDNIRDRLVVGILDKAVSHDLQMKAKLTLNEAIELIRQSESVKDQVSVQTENPKSIEELHSQKLQYGSASKHKYQRGNKPAKYHQNVKSSCGGCVPHSMQNVINVQELDILLIVVIHKSQTKFRLLSPNILISSLGQSQMSLIKKNAGILSSRYTDAESDLR